jgi:hypothetical protein
MTGIRQAFATLGVLLLLTACGGSHRGGGTAGRSHSSQGADCRGVARACGTVAKLDAASGAAIWRLHANGDVDSVVPDGHGGAFLAGGFTRVAGTPQRFVAHVLANGSIDTDWRPTLWSRQPARYTQPMLAIRRGVLFVSGVARRNRGAAGVIAISADNGQVESGWGRGLRVDGGVPMVTSSKYLLVGGTVTRGNGVRTGLAALDISTGMFAAGFSSPPLSGGEGTGVNALLLTRGRLFVGGQFVRVGHHPATSLIAVSPRTGRLLTGWAPHLSPCAQCVGFSIVYGLAAGQSGVYVAAAARRIDGKRRAGGALIDALTGSVRSWAPRFSGQPEELVSIGHRIYAGGDFTSVDGIRRLRFAALDAISGRVLPSWRPAATTDAVLSIAASRRNVFVGTIDHSG